jgi:hypothetical protein
MSMPCLFMAAFICLGFMPRPPGNITIASGQQMLGGQ